MAYRTLAIAAGIDEHLCDSSGAFVPGAQKFAKAFRGTFSRFSNTTSQAERKKNFIKAIAEATGGLDLFAYFGHGFNTQLGSAGINTEKDQDELAEVLKSKLKPDAIVVLYACLAGIENGFSTKFQGKLGAGIWVYGHTTVGHSFINPDVSEVQSTRSPKYRRIYPYGSELRGPWSVSLKYTDMWLRFPIMWDVYIERELNAVRLLGEWKVSLSGRDRTYLFEWSRTDSIYESLASLNTNPSGTVTEKATGTNGTWQIVEQLQISWASGEKESWPLPLKTKAQTGTAGSASLKATRIKNTQPGKKVQG